MNIFDLIAADHEKLRGKVTAVRRMRASTPREISRAFTDLKQELLVHHEAEQHVLFIHLAKLDSLGGEALHAVEEHGEHRKLLEMMEDMPSFGSSWWNAYDELAHDVLHHLDEEERDIFPLAERHLQNDTIEELGKAYATSKGGYMSAMKRAA
jgi:iron-sulfur cluster repair protein YtfE (RIC family)